MTSMVRRPAARSKRPVNKARHVAEHAPGRRAHAAHAEHRREEPSAEADGVASRPARLRGHGLARHVADEKRDGRQMTGAQERAHDAPGEAPQHGQPELVLDEVVDSDEQVFEHAIPPAGRPGCASSRLPSGSRYDGPVPFRRRHRKRAWGESSRRTFPFLRDAFPRRGK